MLTQMTPKNAKTLRLIEHLNILRVEPAERCVGVHLSTLEICRSDQEAVDDYCLFVIERCKS